MRIWSPQALLHRIVTRLPRGIGDIFWNVTYLLAWVSLPYTVMGALRDLSLVLNAVSQLMNALPDYRDLLRSVGSTLTAALEVWRWITEPIRDLIAQMNVPFAAQLSDLAVLGLLILPSLLRFLFERRNHERASRDLETARQNLEALRDQAAEREGVKRTWATGLGAGVGVLGVGLIGPAAVPLGIALANGLSSLGDRPGTGREPGMSSQLSRAEKSRIRLGQSILLVRVSLVMGLIVLVLVISNWFFAPAMVDDAMCSTRRAVGETCSCFIDPDRNGISTPAPDGNVNLCLPR